MSKLRDRLLDYFDANTLDDFSVVWIRTAQPKLMLFGPGSKYPDYVAQLGKEEELSRTFEFLQFLARGSNGLVPSPVYRSQASNGEILTIQTGVEGMPWFNVRSMIRTDDDWRNLACVGSRTLAEFQAAVERNPSWSVPCNPAEQLLATLSKFQEAGGVVSDELRECVLRQTDKLAELPTGKAAYAHGDFSVNNLIVGDNRASVIDLEHFARVNMPLHDELLLTHSLMRLSERRGVDVLRSVWETVQDCGSSDARLDNNYAPACWLHLLLWWGVETRQNAYRHDKSVLFEGYLNRFCQLEASSRRTDPMSWIWQSMATN